MDIDKVFKALGDPMRVKVLDLLHERNGQTLGELCEHLAMSRPAATQHIGVLAAAQLVTAVWRGREQRHSINAVPAASLDDPSRSAPQAFTYRMRALPWDPVDPALPAFDRLPTA